MKIHVLRHFPSRQRGQAWSTDLLDEFMQSMIANHLSVGPGWSTDLLDEYMLLSPTIFQVYRNNNNNKKEQRACLAQDYSFAYRS